MCGFQFKRRESTSSTSSGESDDGTPIDGPYEGDYYTDVIQNKSFTVCISLNVFTARIMIFIKCISKDWLQICYALKISFEY